MDDEAFEIEYAREWHRRHREETFERDKLALQSATVAIRGLLLINGAATVALLAFLGAVWNVEGDARTLTISLIGALYSFAYGVGLAGVTAGLAYFTNLLDVAALDAVNFRWEHPYYEEKPAAKRVRVFRNIFHVLALAAAIATAWFFFSGVEEVASAMRSINPAAP